MERDKDHSERMKEIFYSITGWFFRISMILGGIYVVWDTFIR